MKNILYFSVKILYKTNELNPKNMDKKTKKIIDKAKTFAYYKKCKIELIKALAFNEKQRQN